MENAILILAVVLFLLICLRFVRRVRQELRRQRSLTWPRAVATLADGQDELPIAAADRHGDAIFYEARLVQPYSFYARGQKFTGDRLAPELTRLNPSEARMFLKELGARRRYYVIFDPHEPEKNYLTVGNRLLGYPHLLLYSLYGLVLPLLLWFLMTNDWSVGAVGTVIAWIAAAFALLFVGVYYLVQPLFNLGLLLSPAPDYGKDSEDPDASDGLLESLSKRPMPQKADQPTELRRR